MHNWIAKKSPAFRELDQLKTMKPRDRRGESEMKQLCIGVIVASGVLGLGWLGGIDYVHQHNVATMLWVGVAVWAGYMSAVVED